MTTEADGNSLDGTPPETFAPALEQAGADVIGVNCSVGPAAMLETIEAIARISGARLVAQPNAGRPRDVEGRNLYLSSPDYMASYARRFTGRGCSTGGRLLRNDSGPHQADLNGGEGARACERQACASGVVDGKVEPVAPVDRADKSGLARTLAAGAFATVVEVSAPRGWDLEGVVAQAKRFRELGAAAVNIPDYPKSGARASALSLGVLVEQQGDIEVLLHYCCRDRTLIGMQSDLVGAHAMGVRNVLLVTGNPAPRAHYADATVRVRRGRDWSDQHGVASQSRP
jgi:homocysteine S-methyltransferase